MKTDLVQMRAERDRLDSEIRAAEQAQRGAWNKALVDVEVAFSAWLREQHVIDVDKRERKNAEIWDIGNGALVATFARDEENYRRALYVQSGATLRLEWSEVPGPARFLAVVAVLLGRA